MRRLLVAKESARSKVRSLLPLSATVIDQSYEHSVSRNALKVVRLLTIECSSLRTGIVMSTLAPVTRRALLDGLDCSDPPGW